MAYPKWKYRNSEQFGFQSTLVSTPEADLALAAAGWLDDPLSFGVDVVPYPCELMPNGMLHLHVGIGQDANGNYAHGPRPTVAGMSGAQVMKDH